MSRADFHCGKLLCLQLQLGEQGWRRPRGRWRHLKDVRARLRNYQRRVEMEMIDRLQLDQSELVSTGVRGEV